MAREPIAVRIEKDLHQKVKSAAPLRGTNLEGAYDEALRNWLEEKAKEPGQVLAEEVQAMKYYSESVTVAVNQVAHSADLLANAIACLEKALSDARGKRALAELQSIPVIEDGTPIERAAERVVRAREAAEADRGDYADATDRLANDRAAARAKKPDHRRPSRGAA
jgi:hypothetical protein